MERTLLVAADLLLKKITMHRKQDTEQLYRLGQQNPLYTSKWNIEVFPETSIKQKAVIKMLFRIAVLYLCFVMAIQSLQSYTEEKSSHLTLVSWHKCFHPK